MKPQPDKRSNGGLRAYLPALVMFGVFLVVGVVLWLVLGNLFYLANFAYIGSALAAGIALMIRKSRHARISASTTPPTSCCASTARR